jgi:hypothetical protein
MHLLHLSGSSPTYAKACHDDDVIGRPLRRRFSGSSSVSKSGDDLDSVWDSILDDVLSAYDPKAAGNVAFNSSLNDVMSHIEQGITTNLNSNDKLHSFPDILVEEEPDFTNPNFLSITYQYWESHGLEPVIISVCVKPSQELFHQPSLTHTTTLSQKTTSMLIHQPSAKSSQTPFSELNHLSSLVGNHLPS